MGDLVVFISIVGLMVAAGVAVGMIVATRLDRIMTPPRPEAPAQPGDADGTPATAAVAAPTTQEPQP